MSKFIDSLKKHTSKIFASRTAKPQNQPSNVNFRQQRQNPPQPQDFYPFMPINPPIVIPPPPAASPPPPGFRIPLLVDPSAMPFYQSTPAYPPAFNGPTIPEPWNIPVFNRTSTGAYDAGIRPGLYQEPTFNRGFPAPGIVITDIGDNTHNDNRPNVNNDQIGNEIKTEDKHETKNFPETKTDPPSEKQNSESSDISQTPKDGSFVPHHDHQNGHLNESNANRSAENVFANSISPASDNVKNQFQNIQHRPENVFANSIPPASDNVKNQFQNIQPPPPPPPLPSQFHNPNTNFNVSSTSPNENKNSDNSFHNPGMNFNISSTLPNTNKNSTVPMSFNDTIANANPAMVSQLPPLNSLTPSQKQTIDALIYTMQRTKDKEAIHLILNEIMNVANPKMKHCLESIYQYDQFQVFKRPLSEKTFPIVNTHQHSNTYFYDYRKETSSKPILYFRCDGIPLDNLCLLQCAPVI